LERDAADHRDDLDVGVLCRGGEVIAHLHCQLSRGREDERAEAACVAVGAFAECEDAVEHRQAERERLAGPCVGGADHVAAKPTGDN